MAAIFGPGGPIILPWEVRGDRFRGGTVHGVTTPPTELPRFTSGRDRVSPPFHADFT